MPVALPGACSFVCDFLPPANQLVGELWARGQIEIHEEHLYTEQVTCILRETLAVLTIPQGHPGDADHLCRQSSMCWSLLMAEALFRLSARGAGLFGADLPLTDIAQAAQAPGGCAGVVVLTSLRWRAPDTPDCRRLPPPQVELWVGGAGAGCVPSPAGHWQILRNLHDIEPLLQDWRQRHLD